MALIIEFGVPLVVLIGCAGWLLSGTQPAPKPMTVAQLEAEGLTPQQIRAELRAQRQEARAASRARSDALRTANQIARTTQRLLKKNKRLYS